MSAERALTLHDQLPRVNGDPWSIVYGTRVVNRKRRIEIPAMELSCIAYKRVPLCVTSSREHDTPTILDSLSLPPILFPFSLIFSFCFCSSIDGNHTVGPSPLFFFWQPFFSKLIFHKRKKIQSKVHTKKILSENVI